MTTPRVAVDARHLVSGIGTYLENLIPALVASTPWRWRLIGPERWRELADDRVSWISCTTPIYTAREHFEIPRLAGDADLLWVPQYNAPWFWSRRLVVTLHDLIHRMPEFTPPSFKTSVSGWIMGRALRRATRVITVSEYSRTRLAEYFPGSESRCTVIPNGVQPVPADAGPPPVEGPYVLCFGNALPHKNLDRLIEAWTSLPERPERLVVAGPAGRESPRLRRLVETAGSRVRLLGPQDRAGWAALMSHARLYVCPSLEEGFGLPPLEALSAGIPVAAARAASLPEVLDEAAVWFDPTSTEGMATALTRGLDDVVERERVVAAGRERVARHTWQASVEAHVRVLGDALEEAS